MAHRPRSRKAFLWLGALALAICPVASTVAADEDPYRNILDSGYDAQLFQGVETNDALAAARSWVDLVKETYFDESVETQTHVYEDVDAIAKAVRSCRADVVTLTTERFVELRSRVPLDPVFTAEVGGKYAHAFGVIMKAALRQGRLSDLKDKRVILCRGGMGGISGLWLEVELAREGLPEPGSFFGRYETVAKVSQAVLPVFFGQADACIVPVESFATMVELNPQIGRSLRVIRRSPGFNVGIVCIRSNTADDLRPLFMDALGNLHKREGGRQILSLFGTDRLIPFKAGQITSVENLLDEHRALLGRSVHSDLGSRP